MYHLDHNPNVLEWASEPFPVPYVHPLDNKVHRYFFDFLVKMRHKDGSIKNTLIEVKPRKETAEPKKPKTPSRRYMKESAKYLVNTAKWEAAKKFCDKNDIDFKIMTEYDIYGPSGKKNSNNGKHAKKTSKTKRRRSR